MGTWRNTLWRECVARCFAAGSRTLVCVFRVGQKFTEFNTSLFVRQLGIFPVGCVGPHILRCQMSIWISKSRNVTHMLELASFKELLRTLNILIVCGVEVRSSDCKLMSLFPSSNRTHLGGREPRVLQKGQVGGKGYIRYADPGATRGRPDTRMPQLPTLFLSFSSVGSALH